MARLRRGIGVAVLAVLVGGAAHAQSPAGQQGFAGLWGYAEGGSSLRLQSDGPAVEGRLVQPSPTMKGAGMAPGTVAFRGRADGRGFEGERLVSYGDPKLLKRLRESCNVAAVWVPVRGTLSPDHKAIDLVYSPYVLVRDGNACQVYIPHRDGERYHEWVARGQGSWVASQTSEATGQLLRRP
jgi:hypothetical protein